MKIYIKRKKLEPVKRRHPWIFSGAVASSLSDHPSEGDIVDVYSEDGDFLAKGYYELGSIAVRTLTYDADEEIDNQFWHKRLSNALLSRHLLPHRIAEGHEASYRLVHGEGDFCPGLIIDVYGEVAVMQAHTVGIHRERENICEALLRLLPHLKGVYYKSETTLPPNIADEERSGVLYGEVGETTSCEYDLRFYPDIYKGQKTGFFLDQRENRHLLEEMSSGKSVLNMFCYSGGFSMAALRGGASRVTSVDSSARAIEMTKKNLSLNFDENDLQQRHEAVVADAFKYLKEMDDDLYDLIILDPPAFAKHNGAVHNALQGYRRINSDALKKIRSGGILFTFSCSQAINALQFRQAIFTAALIAERNVKILHMLHQPGDHPVSIYHPEGEYLKGLVLYVE